MSAACLIKERVEMHVLQGSSALTRAGMLLELGLTRVLEKPATTQQVTIKGAKQVWTELPVAMPIAHQLVDRLHVVCYCHMIPYFYQARWCESHLNGIWFS